MVREMVILENKYMDELSFILNMKGAAKNEYPFIKSLDKKCRSE